MLRSRTWYLEVEACEISTAGVCPKNTCHLKPKPKAGEERYKTLKSQGWEGQRDNIQMTCEASQVLDAQSNASSNLRFQERKPLQKHHGLWLKWGSLGSPTVVTCPWAFVDIWCPFPWAVAPFFYIPELHLSNMFTRVFFQIAVMKPLKCQKSSDISPLVSYISEILELHPWHLRFWVWPPKKKSPGLQWLNHTHTHDSGPQQNRG